MAANSGTKAVVAAMLGNGFIAIAKFVGFLITQSSSMLSESIHSVADSGNQALLLLGGKRAAREADSSHQFGHGRERYFWSFVVALVLFALGSAFAIFHGTEQILHALEHPEDAVDNLTIAIVILSVSIVAEGFSFRIAIKESIPLKGDLTWWQFIKRSRTPELPVVLLEDLGAMVGLLIALSAVVTSSITQNAIWDGIGSVTIGLLLGVIAVILILEMRSLLLGESADASDMAKLEKIIDSSDVADSLIHLRTQFLGPDQLLVAAKISVASKSSIDELTEGINSLENDIREAIPYASPIYIEPDLLKKG